MADLYFEIEIEIPRLKIISNYSVIGRLLIININETDLMETNLGKKKVCY